MRSKRINGPVELRFWSKVEFTDSCWLWTACRIPYGHGQFRVAGKNVLAHRWAYEYMVGPIPDGLRVCHDCPGGDNPACVNPAHLFLGTALDNSRDMVRKGRAATGDRHGYRLHPEARVRGDAASWTKVTDAQVREIREAATRGVKQRVLAEQYGVAQCTISEIVHRRKRAGVI